MAPTPGMNPQGRQDRQGRRRPRWGWYAFLALLVVPVAEIALIVKVGTVIGGWQTLALLLVESALGAYLVKREGRRSWQSLRVALNTGRMPGRELADAALVLIGGTLLLTPGFLTDIAGFLFVLPFTRPITRRWLQRVVERRLLGGSGIIRGEVI
ncbi:MAG: protein FxsA [Actinomycetota bacterium]|nr:protein FxsA [Actinomycetota bacterium]